ncbi:ABC transporter ATP-binding protein [Algihabitans sp.]|uniref:ABC transporter ATP-binding protein n=1 Tax=Algihabitans sp. TaxID=2821514 RepID=UPI003BAD6E8A
MTAATSLPKIQIRDLHVSFGKNKVLQGVNLDIASGDSLVVIGGSGSGKSVLLKCILGLLSPQSGSIKIDGEEIVGLSGDDLEAVRHKIGMLFQSAALFDSLSVWENIAFGLMQGEQMPRREAKAVAIKRLVDVGLQPEVGALMPAELSGGMKKRVGLARAIATEPEIIFFDEPTTGLDPIMGAKIDKLIVEVTHAAGATGLTITHDMASARRISNRMAMLFEGRIIWDGATDQVEACGNPYVEQFINGRPDGPIEMQIQDHFL